MCEPCYARHIPWETKNWLKRCWMCRCFGVRDTNVAKMLMWNIFSHKRTNESMIHKFDLQCSIFSDVFFGGWSLKIGDNRRHNDRMFIPTCHDFHDFTLGGGSCHSLHLCWGTGASAGSWSGGWDIQRLGSCRASLEWNHDPRWLGTLDLERKSSQRWRKLPQVVFGWHKLIKLDVRGKHVWNIFGMEMMYLFPTEVEAHPHWAPISSTISEWCNVLWFSRSPLKITNVFPKTSKAYSLLEYSTETGCIRWVVAMNNMGNGTL